MDLVADLSLRSDVGRHLESGWAMQLVVAGGHAVSSGRCM